MRASSRRVARRVTLRLAGVLPVASVLAGWLRFTSRIAMTSDDTGGGHTEYRTSRDERNALTKVWYFA